MGARMNAWLQQQQRRFMRADAWRYLRPDVGRYLAPERKWEGQPRIAAGSPDAGQFTFGTQDEEGNSGRDHERVYIYTPRDAVGEQGDADEEDDDENSSGPVNHLDEIVVVADRNRGGGAEGEPGEDWINSSERPGIGHNSNGAEFEPPPEIPETKPSRSPSAVLRAAASWIARALAARAFGAVSAFIGILNARSWARAKAHEVVTSLDPPRSMKELEDAVGMPRRGTELHHHKMEQHVSKQRGIPQSEIDAPGNRVRIPTFKHYDITAWYQRPNDGLGGLTPRQYLADKPAEEHARIGREALILFEVLKP